MSLRKMNKSQQRLKPLTLFLLCLHILLSVKAVTTFLPVAITTSRANLLDTSSATTSSAFCSPTILFRSGSIQYDGKSNTLLSMAKITNNNDCGRLIVGMKDIVEDYDVFLLDMWGVLHDGTTPYDGVLDAIRTLKETYPSKKLIVLSNSSKRKSNSIRMLNKLGFQPDAHFDEIVTSGEVTYDLLRRTSKNTDNGVHWDKIDYSNRKVFILGSGDEDYEYVESCDWVPVSDVSEASLILARGTFTIPTTSANSIHKESDAGSYKALLSKSLDVAAEKQIPMLVANPDKIRPDAQRSPMPGSIGDAYETALQHAGVSDPESFVKRIGKPFADVYITALQRLSNPDLTRVCMVGDALETDVAGGSAHHDMDTIWVLRDGVYKPEFDAAAATDSSDDTMERTAHQILDDFNAQTNTYAKERRLHPTILLPNFRW